MNWVRTFFARRALRPACPLASARRPHLLVQASITASAAARQFLFFDEMRVQQACHLARGFAYRGRFLGGACQSRMKFLVLLLERCWNGNFHRTLLI